MLTTARRDGLGQVTVVSALAAAAMLLVLLLGTGRGPVAPDAHIGPVQAPAPAPAILLGADVGVVAREPAARGVHP